jgi:predicted small secreted protein
MQMVKTRTLVRTNGIEFGSSMLGLMAVWFMLLAPSGCNTARGMGEDLSAAGDAITQTFQGDEHAEQDG